MLRKVSLALGMVAILCVPAAALDLTAGLESGTVDLKSAGPLAFGPDGILFVGDSEGAAIFAIATDDTSGNPEATKINVDGLNKKIAASLGVEPADIAINDLAVNPLSGNAYLSVARGSGPTASAVILRVDASGQLSEVSLKNAKYSKAELPDAPGPEAKDRRNQSLRAQSITDLAYLDGRVLIAGLSNEEFASTLRSIPFPFKSVDAGTSVEVFHGAHGRFETNSPVRTFATYEINKEPHLLAAYTCTPLVRFPLSDLSPGKKIRGTTIAELGNRNRPLDMFVYSKGGKDYILMANSSRGMMKITTDDIDRKEGIVDPVSDKEGQSYDTIDSLKGVVQLDRLNEGNALVIVETEDGSANLKTVALP